MPPVEEQDQRWCGSPDLGRSLHMADHLDGGRHAGQLEVGQLVVVGDHGETPRLPWVHRGRWTLRRSDVGRGRSLGRLLGAVELLPGQLDREIVDVRRLGERDRGAEGSPVRGQLGGGDRRTVEDQLGSRVGDRQRLRRTPSDLEGVLREPLDPPAAAAAVTVGVLHQPRRCRWFRRDRGSHRGHEQSRGRRCRGEDPKRSGTHRCPRPEPPRPRPSWRKLLLKHVSSEHTGPEPFVTCLCCCPLPAQVTRTPSTSPRA